MAATIQRNPNYNYDDALFKIIQLKTVGGHSYIDIALRNHASNVNSAVEELVSLYEKYFGYGMSLSGFQFVGLVVDNKPTNLREEISFFILGLGFFASIAGALLAFISIEFFKSLKNEPPEFIVEGCIKYKHLFRSADYILFVDTGLFLLSLNVLAHSVIRTSFAVVLNTVAFLLLLFLCYCHYIVVHRRQEYRTSDGRILTRNVYNDSRSPSVILGP